jgi:hypothetical protein
MIYSDPQCSRVARYLGDVYDSSREDTLIKAGIEYQLAKRHCAGT